MYVYFIKAGRRKRAPVKIGVASNIERRLATLQTGNHRELLLLAAIKCETKHDAYRLESMFHRMLKRHKMRGEWFRHDLNLKAIERMSIRGKFEWAEEEMNEQEADEFDPETLYALRGV